MLSNMRAFVGAALVSVAAAPSLIAQASPYLTLDDPRLPLLEHLIARGDVEDPSPMMRPFRIADAIRVLAAADTAPERSTGSLIHRLRVELTPPPGEQWWAVQARLGGEAYTQKRRDPLHLGGPGTENPYFDLGGWAVFGPIAGGVRPAIQPSLIGDPDWPNRAQQNVTTHLIEGYLSGQWKFVTVDFGQLDRNWGPVGLPGIPLSNVGYERHALALDLGNRVIHLSAVGVDLRRQDDSLGQAVNRYYFAHRLAARLSSRFQAALWETIVLSGVGRTFELPFANPLSPSVLTNSFGIADTGSNVMIGADFTWRFTRRATFQAQLALDDFWFNHRNEKQDRWGFTLMAYGPLGNRLGWRAAYTQVSSLALRTFNPQENFTDLGVGIGRNFSDMDQFWAWVQIPIADRWLVTPEAVFQRQGEGKIDDPYPPLVNGNTVVPMLFIGTVEKTARLGMSLSGRAGPLDVVGNVGVNHVTNDQNQPGVTANRVVARVLVALRWGRQGVFRQAGVEGDGGGSSGR